MANLVYLSDVAYNPETVLTVGTFDGVHEGHRSIIQRVVESARESGSRSLLVTFDPHPRDILNPGVGGIKLLTTLEERTEILAAIGIDEMVVIPFTRDFSLMESEEFITEIIHKKIGVSRFIIGYDHHFGRDRQGSIDTLRRLSETLGFDVDVVKAHEIGEITISSTIVRRELEQNGNIEVTRGYLGRPYQLKGTVIHGDKRGRTIGFPTANLRIINSHKIIPKNGVYVVDVQIEKDAAVYRGMMNIGTRPTFTELNERRLEVHILDFNQDLYGKVLTVRFLRRLRDEKSFDGLDALKMQLREDERRSRDV